MRSLVSYYFTFPIGPSLLGSPLRHFVGDVVVAVVEAVEVVVVIEVVVVVAEDEVTCKLLFYFSNRAFAARIPVKTFRCPRGNPRLLIIHQIKGKKNVCALV